MILYTHQPLYFDIVKSATDLNKSEYYKEDDWNFKHGYDYLFNRIGSSSWIWCYGYNYIDEDRPPLRTKMANGEWNKRTWRQQPYRLWILDVPKNKIKCIDTDMWHSVLNKQIFNFKLYDYIEELDLLEQDKEKLYDNFESELLKFCDREVTYKNLLKQDKWNIFDDQFLIPSPIKRNWVKRTYTITPDQK